MLFNVIIGKSIINLISKDHKVNHVKTATLKNTNIDHQDLLSLNASQKYWGILQGEHLAILYIFIELPFVIKIFVLVISELPFTQVLLYMKTVLFIWCNR